MQVYGYECPRCLELHSCADAVRVASGMLQVLCPTCEYVEKIEPPGVVA